MENITYKSLLHCYQPKEQGDFFLQFDIFQGRFIIYSPSKGKLSCIEMLNFTDIKAVELAVLINKVDCKEPANDEFDLPVTCDKVSLLKYLFDIEYLDEETKKYDNYIKPYKGFIMKDISGANRNFFQIGEEQNQLLFDNLCTYQSSVVHPETPLIITFDPSQYERILNDSNSKNNNTILLLSSSSTMLLDKVLNIDNDLILLSGNEDPLLVLKLYIYLLNRQGKIILEYDHIQIGIGFDTEEFTTEDILNVMSAAQSRLRDKFGESLKSMYQARKTNHYIFINCRRSREIILSLNNEIYEMFKPKIEIIL